MSGSEGLIIGGITGALATILVGWLAFVLPMRRSTKVSRTQRTADAIIDTRTEPALDLVELLDAEPCGGGAASMSGSPDELGQRMRELERVGAIGSVEDREASAFLGEMVNEGWDAERFAEQLARRAPTFSDAQTPLGLLRLIGRDPRSGALAHRLINRKLIDSVRHRRAPVDRTRVPEPREQPSPVVSEIDDSHGTRT